MKRVKSIGFVILALVFFVPIAKAKPSPQIIGRWYGFNGSPVTVLFRENHLLTIKTEAFSSLSFTCHYKINYDVSPIELDLTDIPGGMVCLAVVKFSGEDKMEIFGYFNAPGQSRRPTNIETNPQSPNGLYLKLSRDSNIIRKNSELVSAPKSARLAFERNKRLGRGINLNGVLDNNSGDLPVNPRYIKMIAEAGFNSIRLPICWSAHCSKSAPYTIDPAFFKKVDNVVNECLQNNLAVSIDIHYYPYINMGPDKSISFEDNIKRFYLLWKQIGEHYKNYPPTVYFDVLNEPNMVLSATDYNELIAKSIKLIRQTNPHRTILIGTPKLGQSWTIGLLNLPADDWNLIVQIHYYLPHLFTHQGLAYAQAESSLGMKWMGTPAEKQPIESDLGYCVKWGKTHHRPINLGEFGANENADAASRARYIGFMSELAQKDDFSFHLWGFREIFRIFDETTGKWSQPVLDSLIPRKK